MEIELKFKVCDKLHYDYLGHLFEQTPDGRFIVTARNDFGKLLVGHIKDSPRSVNPPDGEFVATLIIPLNEATLNFRNKFIYLNTQAHEQLNLSLRAYFNLDFWEYVQRRKGMKERKEDIIEAFILSRKLFSTECFELLHKRAYRRELKDLTAMKRKLLRRTYFVESLCDDKKTFNRKS